MFKEIYNKSGLFLKNGNSHQRQLGFNARRIIRLRDYYSRKVAAKKVTFADVVTIDEKQGLMMLDGYKALNWTSDVVKESCRAFENLLLKNIEWSTKKHLFSGVIENDKITEDSVFIKFALQEKILGAVINYFGFIPVLSYIGVWYSPGQSSVYANSQLFHCDQADIRQVKVFVYCNDVGPNDGPLHLIDATKSAILRKNLKYNWSESQQCIPDHTIKKYISPDEWLALSAKEGTVILGDTSRCFHFGSRISEKSKDRLVAVFQFLSPYAFIFPWDYKKKLPFSNFNKQNFNDIERRILGLI